MAVDFLEDEAQHRSIDKGLGLFLHFLGALTGKVIGIQELQQVAERRKFGIARFLAVFKHRAAEQGQFAVVQAADADGLALQLANFKERAIKVRDFAVFGVDALGAIGNALGKNLEEEFVELVVIRDDERAHKCVALVSLVIFDQLGLQEFEEEDAVHPADSKRQGDTEQLLLPVFPKGITLFYVVQPVLAVENGDGVFQNGGLVALSFLAAGDDVLVAVLLHHFLQSDNVKQLAIELSVEGVTVVLEALFQQVLRAEELEEFDEALVVSGSNQV